MREEVVRRWHADGCHWQELSCGHVRRVERSQYWSEEAVCKECRA